MAGEKQRGGRWRGDSCSRRSVRQFHGRRLLSALDLDGDVMTQARHRPGGGTSMTPGPGTRVEVFRDFDC